jgi:hypothetical protein
LAPTLFNYWKPVGNLEGREVVKALPFFVHISTRNWSSAKVRTNLKADNPSVREEYHDWSKKEIACCCSNFYVGTDSRTRMGG